MIDVVWFRVGLREESRIVGWLEGRLFQQCTRRGIRGQPGGVAEEMERKGKSHSAEEEKHGLGEQWGEGTGLLGVKGKGQVNSEFDSPSRTQGDVLGRTRDKRRDK